MKYLFYIFFFLFCAATTVTAQTVSQVRSQSTDPTYTPSGAVTAPPLCYNRTTHHLWGYAGGSWYDLTAGTYVDLDPSPTNEKIVSFSVVAGVLRINENGIFYNVPINDIIAAANISSASPTITVTNVAGVVTVTSTDPDESVTNELQNLNLAGQTLSISSGNNVALPVVGVTAGVGMSTSSAAGVITVNNTSPDQTVTLIGAGINAVTGTYPNFMITGTEVDGSTTNECNTAFALTVDSLKITDNCGTLGVPLSAFGTPTFADNGLEMAGDTVHLGGELHKNTSISQLGYNLIIDNVHTVSGLETHIEQSNNIAGIGGEGVGFWTENTDGYLSALYASGGIAVNSSQNAANTQFSRTLNMSGIGYQFAGMSVSDGTTQNDFNVNTTDITVSQYPNTRDDSGVTPPINFLYTDANGVVQSAPTALIASDVCEGLQSLPIGTPQPTNKIVYIGSTAPAGYIGYDFDLPADFGSTDATDTYFHILYLNTAYWYPPATSSPSTPIVIAGNEAAINTFIQNSLIADGFVGDEFTLVVNADNTITIWVKPTYTPNGNEFWWGSSTPDDYTNKIFPTIPTTHFTTGCFLGDAPSGAAKVANGLYTSNDTIKLGGALIENTFVVGAMDKTMILAITDTVNTINKVDLSSAGVQLKSEGSPSTSEVTLNVGDLLLRGETAVKIVTPNTPASPNGSVLTLIDNLTGEAEWQPAGGSSVTVTDTTTLLPTNRIVYVNNGATNITITIPAGDKLLYTITRLDNTSTGTITVQLAGGTIQDVGGTIGATTSISAVAGQRSETFHVTGTVARRTTNQ